MAIIVIVYFSLDGPIYSGKGDVTDCEAYREAKLLKHGMKIVVVVVDDIQFVFMAGRRTTNLFL